MKNIFRFLMAAAIIFGAVSCAKEDISTSLAGGEVEVTLSVDVPELGTRAFGDGMTVNQLFIAVYEQNGTEALPISHIGGTGFQESERFSGGRATVTMVLLKDKTYDLVFWAQNAEANAYTVNLADGRNIVANYGAKCNLEDRDAFFLIRNDWKAGAKDAETEFHLKRPFAQINVANSDDDVKFVTANGAKIETSAMTVKTTDICKQLDLVDGTVKNAINAETIFAANAIPTEEFHIAGYNYLAMNYLLVNEKDLVDLKFEFTDNKNVTYTREYFAVPVQRNYRTNILGQIISSPIDFEVVIDPIFTEPATNVIYLDEPAHPATAEEFLALMENSIVGEVNLDGNIAVQTNYIVIGDKSDIVLNMNNAPLTSGTANDYGLIVRGNAKAEINNANLTSNGGGIGVNDGANVEFSGDVAVNTTNTSGRYNFYVAGNSTLTIKEGNFSFSKRDNKRAYIYVAAGSTVYVEGGNFGKPSTRSGYSAGIMGDGDVIITGGTFEFDPSNWVADGYQAVKNGSKWYVTPDNGVVAATAEELKAAIENAVDGSAIFITPATFEGTFVVNKNISIKSVNPANKATIKGRVQVINSNVAFENVKFDRNDTDSAAAWNASVSTKWLSNNLSVVMIYGDDNNTINFEGCEFYSVNGSDKSAITNITCNLNINNCYFEGTSNAIYSQHNVSVTNSTFNFSGTSNVILTLTANKRGGYVIFKGNTITNKIYALGQFLTTVGYGSEAYHFDLQNVAGKFDKLFANATRVTNKTFAEGSETF